MNGGHDAGNDRRVVVKRFRHGRKTVSGAGRRGNDMIVFRERLVVDVVNDSGKVVARGSGNNDVLRTGVYMRLRLCLGSIETRAFQNDVYAEFSPGKILRFGAGVDGYLLAVYYDSAGNGNGLAVFRIFGVYEIDFMISRIVTLHGIVFEKMSEHLGARKIVYRHYFVAFRPEHLSERKTTYTPESVDCNFGYF